MATGFSPEDLEGVFSNLQIEDTLESCDAGKCVSFSRTSLSGLKKSSKFRLTLDLDRDAHEIFPKSISRDQGQQLKSHPTNKPVHLEFFTPNRIGIDSKDVHLKSEETFYKWITTVETLLELFGSECIQDLAVIYPTPCNGFFEKLTKVLFDISPGVEKLELNLGYEPSSFTGFNWMEWKGIVFPRVKYLSFGGGNEFCISLKFTGPAWTLIHACPNLETLVVDSGNTSEGGMTNWPADLPFPPPGIKSFEYKTIPVVWLLRKMKEHPSLPALENLCLRNFRLIHEGQYDDARNLNCRREILRLFSPSLINLSIPLEPPCTAFGAPPEVYAVPFPLFPTLRNLTISNLNEHFDSIFKINIAAFPVLESLEIPYEIIWTTGSWNLGTVAAAGQGQNQFPSVKHLTLRFSLLRDSVDQVIVII